MRERSQSAASAFEDGIDWKIVERMDREVLSQYWGLPIIDLRDLGQTRTDRVELFAHLSLERQAANVQVRDQLVPGVPGNPDVHLRRYIPVDRTPSPTPCLLWCHGGGHVMGTVTQDDSRLVQIAGEVGCEVCSVDWRWAPEHPFPAALMDAQAVFAWITRNHTDLGLDPRRIAVGGMSSGGGLAAGLCLAARDAAEAMPCFQLLIYPMLDDRITVASRLQIRDKRIWNNEQNELAWQAYLGTDYGTEVVSPYAAPARATDLKGLPATSLMVGDLDLFLAEDIAYAENLVGSGVPTELHVYAGGVHGFPAFAPEAALSVRLLRDCVEALQRAFRSDWMTVAQPADRDSSPSWDRASRMLLRKVRTQVDLKPITTSQEGSIGKETRVLGNRALKGRSRSVTFNAEPEPESLFCPIISVDDHLLEPPDLFETRVPSRIRASAPRVEVAEDGVPWWIIGDSRFPLLTVEGAAGRDFREWSLSTAAYEDFRAGVRDPKARLHDMDISGVWASLCFPSTMWGFAGTRFSKMDDSEVGLACLRAYNDFVLEEWCAVSRERFIPCQLAYMRDPKIAAAEVYMNAERGFRSISFSENPEGIGFPSIYDTYWDPFLRACEETETVLNLHVGSSGQTTRPSTVSSDEVSSVLFPLNSFAALVDWIYARVPLRFPDIQISMSEGGISWVPMAYERLRRSHARDGSDDRQWPTGAPTPMELVGRNFYFTSIDDPSGFRLIDSIGADRIMLEVDYPHPDTTWPKSQELFRMELSGLDADTIRKVCYRNAAQIYRHPEPPPEWIERSELLQVTT